MISRFIAIGSFFLFLVLCILLGPTSIAAFIDIPSAVFVSMLTLASLVAGFGFKNTAGMFATLYQKECSAEKASLYSKMAKVAVCVSIATGILGFIVGTIMVLQDISDPRFVGVGLATALLTAKNLL